MKVKGPLIYIYLFAVRPLALTTLKMRYRHTRTVRPCAGIPVRQGAWCSKSKPVGRTGAILLYVQSGVHSAQHPRSTPGGGCYSYNDFGSSEKLDTKTPRHFKLKLKRMAIIHAIAILSSTLNHI
jgi:hypothetical protein